MDILESAQASVKKPEHALGKGSDEESPTRSSRASGGSLVTNTESTSPYLDASALKAPSLLALEKMQPISRRYVLQSVSKEMLGACSAGSGDGNRPFFYRLGACQQLSASYRPQSSFQEDYSHGLHFSPFPTDDFSRSIDAFADYFASGLSRKTVNNVTSVQMHGLCSCDSNWICPVCHPKVSEYRSKELAYAVHKHQSDNGYCLFLTFTVPHSKKDSLELVLDSLTKSLTRFKSGKAFQGFKSKHGFLGSVRALEWTYTEANGHHPHIHELWFLDKSPDLKTIKDWVYKKYAALVLKHFGQAPSYRHGVDIKLVATNSQVKNLIDGVNLNDAIAMSQYLTKGADVDKSSIEYLKNRDWSIADEMTKSNYKKSRKYKNGKKINSFNAITLIMEYMQLQYLSDQTNSKIYLRDMAKYKSIYNEYAKATFGRAALYWSRGLKDMFGDYDLDDKLLINEHDSEFVKFMNFDLDELQFIIKNRLRATLCNIASNSSHKDDQSRIDAVKAHLALIRDQGRSDRFG